MKKGLRYLCAGLLVAGVCALVVGCGSKSDSPAKVDVNAQVTALKGTEKDAKINACVELAAAKEKAAPAVPALMGCLTDRDPEVRRLAAYALGEIGPPAAKALPALKQLLGDEDRAVMMQAANSCRAIDPKSIPKGLVTQKTATP